MPGYTRETAALWIPIALEIALAAFGFWALWGFPYNNGLLAILKSQTKAGALIPGPIAAPMRQSYTGFGPVDNQLTILVSFFYTAIDGNRGDVSLSFFGLGGHVLASWILITIEGLRSGNQSKWFLTSTTVFGLAVAIVGFACVAPIWFALHLWQSPTVIDPKPFQLLVDSPLQVAITPISTLLGFGLPSLIMCLPAPQILSFETKQLWTGIQQGWPLWIALSQLGLTVLISALNPDTAIIASNELKSKVLKNLRVCYVFALSFGASAHLIVWFFCMLAQLFPVLFAAPYDRQLLPSNVLIPVNPFSNYQAKTLADGALPFLQWDTIIGVASVAIWGLTVRTLAKHETATSGQVIMGVIKIAILSSFVGPAGAAVVSIWGRDELVLNRNATETKAVAAKKGKAN